MSKYVFKILLGLILVNCVFFVNAASKWEVEESKARALYDEGKFDQSIVLFREILLSSDNETIKRETYFYLAKAYISVQKYPQAMTNIEYYLANYEKTGLNYPEAVYQKGLLLYLQEDFEQAYNQLALFAKQYKKNPLISSAYYWMGESMYALGQLDDAQLYFGIVVKKFPKSAKYQTSVYKLELIELKRGELVLQNLLKWSQEQYLATLNQSKIKEKTLVQALGEYRKREAVSDDQSVNAKELINLRSENEQLKSRLAAITKERDDIANAVSGNKDLSKQLEQLRIQQQLLNQKEESLRKYEQKLNDREKSR